MRAFATLVALWLSGSVFADATTPTPSEAATVSPRGTFRIEQACEERPGSGVDVCEVWLVSSRKPAHRVRLAEPDDDTVRAGYESHLRVSPDERYILREQKLYHGAGAAYLYERVGALDYRLTAHSHLDAAAKGLFARQVGVHDDEEDMGIVELDAWSSEGKLLVVTLRGREVAGYSVLDWRYTFDIDSGRAYVTSAQAKANAGTFSRPRPRP